MMNMLRYVLKPAGLGAFVLASGFLVGLAASAKDDNSRAGQTTITMAATAGTHLDTFRLTIPAPTFDELSGEKRLILVLAARNFWTCENLDRELREIVRKIGSENVAVLTEDGDSEVVRRFLRKAHVVLDVVTRPRLEGEDTVSPKFSSALTPSFFVTSTKSRGQSVVREIDLYRLFSAEGSEAARPVIRFADAAVRAFEPVLGGDYGTPSSLF